MSNQRTRTLLISFAAAFVAAAFLFLYLNLESINADAGVAEFTASCLARLMRPYNIVLVLGVLVAGTFAFSKAYPRRERIFNFVYRHRWWLALGTLALCVLFEVSGSSIGRWYDGTGWDGTLFGAARGCRSDEYLVNTPMAFAQFFNDAGAWQYFGETFRGTLTDMFIVYGQPVADPAIVFRPFHWGYLLFGPERGLSFFWCARVLALFMCTFEVGMLLSGKRRALAVCLALLVTFSPVLSWWLDVNGYVEMIVSCEVMLLIIAQYMKTSSYKVRAALGLPFVICGGCFVLTFYPALQVPMAYLFFVMAIIYLVKHRHDSPFCWKDAVIIGVFFLVFCVGMAYVFGKSWDTVQAVLNTAYPGHRIDTGGGALPLLVQYPMDVLTPLRSFAETLRIDAYSAVYDFFPLGILLALWVVLKERTRDAYLLGLLVLSVFFGWYCFVGMPEPVAKLTLMSYSTGGLYSKAFIAFGLVNLLLLVRALSLVQVRPGKRVSLVAALVLGIALSVGCAFVYGWFFNAAVFVVCAAVLCLGLYLLLRRSGGGLVAYIVVLALFMGVMVNPVQLGASPLLENQTRQAVLAVNESDPDSRWAATGTDSSANAALAATTGASVINTCNVYPNLELWQRFDPEGAFDDVYNRYAHIAIQVTDEETHFGDAAFDSFTLYINPDDVKLLEVDYLLSDQALEAFSTDKTTFARISDAGERSIYRVEVH